MGSTRRRTGSAFLARHINEVVEQVPDAAAVAVDIPIGSEPDRFRRVDVEAIRFVGPRWNTIFAVPPLHLLFQAERYALACLRCRELTGGAPSKQAWEPREKILEVGDLAERDSRIVEVHPEVSFRALLEKPLAHPKKTWAGQHLRRSELARAGIVLPEELGSAGVAAPDDVLDAAVAAWSAHRYATGTAGYLEPKVLEAGVPLQSGSSQGAAK